MPITEMFFSLHTEHPGAIGERPANEIDYPEYARVAAARSARGWTDGPLIFPKMHYGDAVLVAKYWAVSSRAGYLMHSGTLCPPITVTAWVTPQVILAPLDDLAAAIEAELERTPTAADRAALQAIRGVVADAAGHPARDAALRAIDRLGSR